MTWDMNLVIQQAHEAEAELAQLRNERDALAVQLDAITVKSSSLETQLAAANAKIKQLEEAVVKPAVLKPALRGLVTTDPAYRPKYIPYAEFASKKVYWNALETSAGNYNFSAIDTMLAAHPGIKFRIRLMAGTHAPDFVKQRSGGAIQHVPDTATGAEGLVPRFWTDNYYADYMRFWTAFAAKYEKNPQVVEVTSSLTTTIYAEPLILNADPATITRYWNAGYRFPAVEANLRKSIDAMMGLFPTTRVSLAGHGKWEYIENGSITRSWEKARTLFNDLIATYGPRLVLDDHGLGADDPLGTPQSSDTATTWYNYMAGRKNTPTTYGWQFTPKDFSMEVAARNGVTMGACFEEFAAFSAIPEPARQQIHEALIANGKDKP